MAFPPWVFTKILAALAAHLRTILVRVQLYLDDILVQLASWDRARSDLSTIVGILQSHGFSINEVKSHFIPTTRILHLGAWVDTVAGQVFPSSERQDNLKQLVAEVEGFNKVSLATLSKLLGKMVLASLSYPGQGCTLKTYNGSYSHSRRRDPALLWQKWSYLERFVGLSTGGGPQPLLGDVILG